MFVNFQQKREDIYDEYLKSKFIQAKAELRELLKECKMITHKYYLFPKLTSYFN